MARDFGSNSVAQPHSVKPVAVMTDVFDCLQVHYGMPPDLHGVYGQYWNNPELRLVELRWLRERFEVLRPMAEAEQGLTLDFADEPVAELQLH